MKHLKTYEGFLSHLKGKSFTKEEFISKMKDQGKTYLEIIQQANEYGLKLELTDIYSQEEINDFDNDVLIFICILTQDYSIIPRNEKGEIIYDGSLYCNNNELNVLPDNLTVRGDLDCGHNNITELPDNLTVNGYLYCSYNKLTELPDNLTVKGNLWCEKQKTGIKLELPETAVVKGKFYN